MIDERGPQAPADQAVERPKPSAWKRFSAAINERAIADQERKARVHEMKAGKTFRRTKKHLRKAERAQRVADRMR